MIWKEEDIEILITNYPNYGLDFCADCLKIERKLVKSKIQRLGLTLNKETKYIINKKRLTSIRENPKKYKIDFGNFKNITEPEVAYTLGFMWGDGYIQNSGIGKTNRVAICENLKEDIDSIIHIFKKTGNWNTYIRKRLNKKEIFSVFTNNILFCEYLISKDYDKKSYTSPNKILEIIPNNLKNYFFLGLSDADGCFYIKKGHSYQFSLTSKINQDWDYMIKLCKKLHIKLRVW